MLAALYADEDLMIIEWAESAIEADLIVSEIVSDLSAKFIEKTKYQVMTVITLVSVILTCKSCTFSRYFYFKISWQLYCRCCNMQFRHQDLSCYTDLLWLLFHWLKWMCEQFNLFHMCEWSAGNWFSCQHCSIDVLCHLYCHCNCLHCHSVELTWEDYSEQSSFCTN